jgi:glucosamine-6-phosphate deaminase
MLHDTQICTILMFKHISPDSPTCGAAAARHGASQLRKVLSEKGRATIIVATGASQFQMLARLVQEPDIAWEKVTAYHLDEYAGMPVTHPASFRRFLWERFVCKLPVPLAAFHYINAENDLQAECERLGRLIAQETVDLAFIGIGENAHIAFNDPPADFQTESPYLVVPLDEACRGQQLGEGWFPNLAAVPTQAISMSPRQIMKTRHIVCTVPDARKAWAVGKTVNGPVTSDIPASILQNHSSCFLFLDSAAASEVD